MKQCASTVKKLSLELGGNAPFIVFDDADLDAAADGAIASKYRNAGQTCVCANRLLVEDDVYDAFCAKLVRTGAKIQVGNGLEAGVTIGPLIDEPAVAKVESHIDDAVPKGCEASCSAATAPRRQTVLRATVLTEATPRHAARARGDVRPRGAALPVRGEAEAIALANDTEYGLAAYFYGRDMARIWRVAEALEYGIIGVNTGIISMEVAPFGGMKESGIGREGSKYGLDEFLEIKYVCLGGM